MTALDDRPELTVTHDDALPFVPDGVRADFPTAPQPEPEPANRGSAKIGEFFPDSRRRPIKHGTTGGYRAHFRHNEPLCEPCRAAERKRLGYAAPQKRVPCGTPSAYDRHRRRGEPTCEPCKDAHNAHIQAYRRRTGRVTAPVPRKIKRREAAPLTAGPLEEPAPA